LSTLINGPSLRSGLVYLVSAPASPLLGLMMDKTGRNISWVLMAVAGSIGCHLLLAFTRNHPTPFLFL
jgi:hypothetical protein